MHHAGFMRDKTNSAIGITSIEHLTLSTKARVRQDMNMTKAEGKQNLKKRPVKILQMLDTLSPGVELKSPATMTSGMHSYLSDTRVLNCAKRDRR